MTDTESPKTAARPRLGRAYWQLWVASVVSNLGDGVSQVAYPWLASAVTRNPLLLAGIAIVQRIPWLVFTLPAGVITDRVDRRKLIVAMHWTAFATTLVVALLVLAGEGGLPDPGIIGEGEFETGPAIYLALLYVSALVFGMAEVLRDNASQTILPAIVEPEGLEKANGWLWSAEMVANSFAGPPLGGLLVSIGFAIPFFFDAGTFALAAGLVFLLSGTFRAKKAPATKKVSWGKEIGEGFRWLWDHPLLRPLAIVLGMLNALNMVGAATFVFFAQEVLEIDAATFGLLGTGFALGGVAGGVLASRLTRLLGQGGSLYATMIASVLNSAIIGSVSEWTLVWAAGFGGSLFITLWNVITVSLRQTIIPDELLGRVNSVYRFFGWGMMPIGTVIGGGIVAVAEVFGSRELALRLPWWIAAAGFALVFVYAAPKLTTAKIEAARAEGLARRQAADE